MKLRLKSYQFLLLISFIQSLVFCVPLLRESFAVCEDYLTIFSVWLFNFVVILLFMLILLTRYTKWLFIPLFLINGAALYFLNTYGIHFDSATLMNLGNTDLQEVRAFVTIKLILYVFGSLIFALLITKFIQVEYQPFKTELKYKLFIIAFIVLFVLLTEVFKKNQINGYINIKHSTDILFKKHKFGYFSIPAGYLVSAIEIVSMRCIAQFKQRTMIDDAEIHHVRHRKTLVVLVIGESARAKNFSLNGYNRNTNELLIDPVINFSNFYSCATFTHLSLKCMFSPFTRDEFSVERALAMGNILDILNLVNVKTMWVSNNSGSYQVKRYVLNNVNPDIIQATKSGLCDSFGCYDELMLQSMNKYIVKGSDNFVVLHTQGSHLPYHEKYPVGFTKWNPVCTASAPENCTDKESMINAYDNSIYYTSYFLQQLINLLKSYKSEFDTLMIYMSDHGESLGEDGVYAHGRPYAIAPDEQKHIPAMMWISEEMATNHKINIECMNAKKNARLSHDYLFHTLLNVFEIKTTVYDNTLDLFDKCIYSH